MRDGDDANSTLIGRYCGDQLPPPVLSTHNFLWLRFKSDSSVDAAGFLANYTTLDVACGGIFTASQVRHLHRVASGSRTG